MSQHYPALPVDVANGALPSALPAPGRPETDRGESPSKTDPGTGRGLHRLLKGLLWLLLAVTLSLVAALLAIRYFLWPVLDRWRPEIEASLSRQLEATVRIGRIEPGRHGWLPDLAVRDLRVTVAGPDPEFAVASAQVALSLSGLLSGRLELTRLELDDVRLALERLEPRRWIVAGALIDLDRASRSPQGWAWLLNTRELGVRGLRLDWHDRLGARSHRVDGLELSGRRAGARHQLALSVPPLASAAAQGLAFRIDALLAAGGHPLDPRSWRGEAHLSTPEIDFSKLAAGMSNLLRPARSPVIVQSGRGPVLLWSEFGDGELRDLAVKARTDALDVTVDGRILPLRNLALEAHARRGLGPLIEIEIQHFSAAEQAGLQLTLDDRPQRLILDADSLKPVELALSSRGADAAALLSAAQRLPLPPDLARSFQGLRASGWIESTGVAWRAAAGSARPVYTVRLDVQRLSLRREAGAPVANLPTWPTLENLSGRVEFNERGGQAWVDSRQVVLTFPGVFAQPALNFASLAGQVGWTSERTRAADGTGLNQTLQLTFEGLQFANADLAGRLTGSYRHTGNGPGMIDLTGQLNRVNATRVSRYLPLVVNPDVRNWVASAVQAGQSEETLFVVRGDLREFPFRDPMRGEFLVESRLRGAQLQFARGWPVIDAIQGRMRFERAGLQIEVERGQLSGVALSEVSARIEDFSRPRVVVRGQGEGRTPQMLAFLEQSPLRGQLDPALRQLQLQGDAQLSLGLEVPLRAGEPTRYRGAVTLVDNRLDLGVGLPPIESLRTQLEFSNERVALLDVSASLLGGPVQGTANWTGGAGLTIEARGRSDAQAVERWLLGQSSGRWLGESEYKLQVGVDSTGIQVRVESDLLGVASQWPAPLAKAAAEPRSLRLDWRRPRANPPAGGAPTNPQPAVEQLRARVGSDIELAFERLADAVSGQYRLARGVLALGRQADLPAKGFTIAARLAHLEVDDWLALARAAPALEPLRPGPAATQPEAPAGLLDAVDRVVLTVDEAMLAGRSFERLVAAGSRQTDGWRVELRSAQLDGRVDWRAPTEASPEGAIRGRFSRLEIPAAPAAPPGSTPNSGAERERSRLPAIDIEASQLVLAGRELGQLSLAAVNAGSTEDPFWRLDRLELFHPGARLSASGRWRPQGLVTTGAVGSIGGGSRTELDFRLGLTDPAKLLATFGLKGALSGGVGRMAGRIAWQGSPLALDYPSMSGLLEIELGRGQFLKTEPGLAKLIGVLNLQSLPRRLNLDFRDLIAEGFAFDEIRGLATLASGVARTEEFRMRGVQAQVDIRGEADLAAESQNLRVRVRPEMNAGLASLAYAAVVNPAVGLGSFLAQLALRKPLQELFSYEYDVTGSWVDPHVVERLRPRVDLPPP